jgi:hypothetical protein
MPALPGSLALTGIIDGSLITAVDHRNNYLALQTAVNALIADLSGAAAGALLQGTSSSAIGYLPDAPIDKNALVWDAATGRWKPQGGALYRKVTTKTINNTVAETDLLNGEITIAANLLGANGALRLTVEGEYMQNTGGPQTSPRFKLKFGATTVFDATGVAANITSSGSRFGYKFVVEIANVGATNAQWVTLLGNYIQGLAGNGAGGFAGGMTTQILVAGGVGPTNIQGALATAEDTTAAKALQLTVILGNAAVTHEITCKRALVEVL